jgi:high-affinity iron transporter
MRIPTILNRILVLGLLLAARPAAAQEHPARRVANIVSVAVEEYGKAVDAQGRLISDQEYQEAKDFLIDARRAADRLSGSNAATARGLVDSIAAAVAARRSPLLVDSLQVRFAAALGNEGRLELPRRALDLAEGKRIYGQSCASCHGATGRGDGPPPDAATGRRGSP